MGAFGAKCFYACLFRPPCSYVLNRVCQLSERVAALGDILRPRYRPEATCHEVPAADFGASSPGHRPSSQVGALVYVPVRM